MYENVKEELTTTYFRLAPVVNLIVGWNLAACFAGGGCLQAGSGGNMAKVGGGGKMAKKVGG